MNSSTSVYADAVVVVTVGRIDQATSGAFGTTLNEAVEKAKTAGAQIVVDMSGVDYISSVGLRAFMVANKAAQPAKVGIRVAAMTEMVAEVFAISKFDMVFKTFSDVPSALEDVSEAAAAAYSG